MIHYIHAEKMFCSLLGKYVCICQCIYIYIFTRDMIVDGRYDCTKSVKDLYFRRSCSVELWRWLVIIHVRDVTGKSVSGLVKRAFLFKLSRASYSQNVTLIDYNVRVPSVELFPSILRQFIYYSVHLSWDDEAFRENTFFSSLI